MTKPFRVQELLLRIRALLRRGSPVQDSVLLQSGELIYDEAQCQIKRMGIPLSLTLIEWKLASMLITQWPKTVERDALLYRVWDKDGLFVEANTLSVHISRLRDKLGLFQNRNYIETFRGIGYRWFVPVTR